MGTLRKLKLSMKLDKNLRHTLVKGTRNEILIDLDGDDQADLALLDTTGDGDIDTLSMDLTGDGEFNLYFADTDHNHIPDTILFDANGDGNPEILAVGEEVERGMLTAAGAVAEAVRFGEYLAESLDKALGDLEKEIKRARKKLK